MKKILILGVVVATFSSFTHAPIKPFTTRLSVFTQLLDSRYANQTTGMYEVEAIEQSTNERCIGFITPNSTTPQDPNRTYPTADWMWSGWILMEDGCWYHGWFFGTEDNWLFVADSNPMVDQIFGNETFCMSTQDYDNFCRLQ